MSDPLNDHWHEEIRLTSYDYAALGLIGFSVFFGVVLVAYSVGSFFGAW